MFDCQEGIILPHFKKMVYLNDIPKETQYVVHFKYCIVSLYQRRIVHVLLGGGLEMHDWAQGYVHCDQHG